LWYLNLKRDPEVAIPGEGQGFEAEARVGKGMERRGSGG
jgi:hypothetical protein